MVDGFFLSLDFRVKIVKMQRVKLILEFLDITYSTGQKKSYEYCFMKQKCQIQIGIKQYKNAATLLRTVGIYTTHHHFHMRYRSHAINSRGF